MIITVLNRSIYIIRGHIRRLVVHVRIKKEILKEKKLVCAKLGSFFLWTGKLIKRCK
jgi:hypothetical protein